MAEYRKGYFFIFTCSSMQLGSLLARTRCPEPTFKEWLRRGLVVPAQAGQGPGIHAQYDEANVVATALALQMKQAHVVVTKYGGAFRELHLWLRARSYLEWPRYQVVLTPKKADFVPTNLFRGSVRCGFVVDLAEVVKGVGVPEPTSGHQIPLFDLEAVSR